MDHRPHHRMLLGVVLWATVCLLPARSAAAERLCDPSFENCRTPLLTLIAAAGRSTLRSTRWRTVSLRTRSSTASKPVSRSA